MSKSETPIFYNPHDHFHRTKGLVKKQFEELPDPLPLETDPSFEATYKPGEFRKTEKGGCAWCGGGEGICPSHRDELLQRYEEKKSRKEVPAIVIPEIFEKVYPFTRGLIFSTEAVKLKRRIKGLPHWKELERQ